MVFIILLELRHYLWLGWGWSVTSRSEGRGVIEKKESRKPFVIVALSHCFFCRFSCFRIFCCYLFTSCSVLYWTAYFGPVHSYYLSKDYIVPNRFSFKWTVKWSFSRFPFQLIVGSTVSSYHCFVGLRRVFIEIRARKCFFLQWCAQVWTVLEVYVTSYVGRIRLVISRAFSVQFHGKSVPSTLI